MFSYPVWATVRTIMPSGSSRSINNKHSAFVVGRSWTAGCVASRPLTDVMLCALLSKGQNGNSADNTPNCLAHVEHCTAGRMKLEVAKIWIS
ncbi:unnamed protein product [Ceratitis capitata]|uniref:(Mediterranean fruit fly) hypothetical protein n=1 Tax=Ceratitis capitata TaxID=7213 RepID=A0A811U834_CERCA|nr:unnamed protein product [Ceratitis capitata]